jgi:hypothetical protein
MKDILNALDTHRHAWLDPVTRFSVQTCKLKNIGDSVAPPDKIIPNRIELKAIPDQFPANGLK